MSENVTVNIDVIGPKTQSKFGANYEEYLPKNCVDYHDFTEILENFGRSLQKNVIFTKNSG